MLLFRLRQVFYCAVGSHIAFAGGLYILIRSSGAVAGGEAAGQIGSAAAVNDNMAVGGVSNSQHMRGEAADLCIDGDMQKGKRWFEWIKTHCEFDQLIWEKNPKTGNYWVHVSYRADGKNRKKVTNILLKK